MTRPDDLRRLPPAEIDRQITEMRWRLGVAEGQLRKDTRRRLRQLEAVRREQLRAAGASWRDRARTAMAFWGEGAGIALGALLVVVLGGGVLFLTADVRPSRTVYGVVEGHRWALHEEGQTGKILVRVGDRQVMIGRPRTTLCRIGDRVELIEHRLRWNRRSYTVGMRGCASA